MAHSLGRPAGYLTDTLEPLDAAASLPGFDTIARPYMEGPVRTHELIDAMVDGKPVPVEQVDADMAARVAAKAVPSLAHQDQEIVKRYQFSKFNWKEGEERDPRLAVEFLTRQAEVARHVMGLRHWAEHMATQGVRATVNDRDHVLAQIQVEDAAPQIAALGPRPTKPPRRQLNWDARYRMAIGKPRVDQIHRAHQRLLGEADRVTAARKLHMAADLVPWRNPSGYHPSWRLLGRDHLNILLGDAPAPDGDDPLQVVVPGGGIWLKGPRGEIEIHWMGDPWLAAHATEHPILEPTDAAKQLAHQAYVSMLATTQAWSTEVELLEDVVARGRIAAGARSEMRVAETLAGDERLGWVVHEVELAGGDADHVVVGPGVTVVETKTGRGEGAFVRDGTSVNVAVDGQALAAERGSVVNQVRRQASLVSDVLTGVGHNDVEVRIVVCVADLTNGPLELGDVTVCSVADLADVVASTPASLEDKQLEQVARLLAAS